MTTSSAIYAGLMFVIALIPLLIGLLIGWGGLLAWREKLSRARGAGVRTEATLRSEETFRVANKAAALPTMAAGLVGMVAGVSGLVMPNAWGTVTAAVIGIVGMFALLLSGGVLGHKAAVLAPVSANEPQTAPAGCSGCQCGGCGSQG